MIVTGRFGAMRRMGAVSHFTKSTVWSDTKRRQSSVSPHSCVSPFGSGEWISSQSVNVLLQNAVHHAWFRLSSV